MDIDKKILITGLVVIVLTNIFWFSNDQNLRYWNDIKDKELHEKDRLLQDNNYWFQIKDQQLQEKDRQLGNPIIHTSDIGPTSDPAKYIIVKYRAQIIDRFRDKYWNDQNFVYPKPGNIFLIVTFEITNIGYTEFSTGGTDWVLSVSTQDNPNAYIKADVAPQVWGYVDMEYKGATIDNGGYYKAQVPYEVPKNMVNYKLKYGQYSAYNIRWNP